MKRQILSPDLSTSSFTVRSINKDDEAVTTISKAGKKRVRWAKQLEQIQLIPSRHWLLQESRSKSKSKSLVKSPTLQEIKAKIRGLQHKLARENSIVEKQAKEEMELNGLIDRLITKYSSRLAVAQTKSQVTSLHSTIKTLEREISSMRMDMIQWKGMQLRTLALIRSDALALRHHSSNKKEYHPTKESLLKIWYGATAALHKSWATCA
jgi:hypothetical protein